MAVVVHYRRPAHLGEGVDRGVQGHRSDDIRGAGLLPVRGRGPDDPTELDKVDRPATGPCNTVTPLYRDSIVSLD
jgi:hypothetical protein